MLDFGITAQEFRTRYLEQQAFLRKAALSERPMQWSDLDSLLHSLEPNEISVQLFNNGQLPPQSYLEDSFEFGQRRRRLNKHRFYGLLQHGATLVLNRVENDSVHAKRLCAEVGRFVGHQTTSNAYASFGGGGSFGKHWDTHDVFAIQLIGRKRWQVFAPSLPFPLSHQTSEAHRYDCPPAPLIDCVLSAGDLLYVPRGWWHQTLPFDEGSLHLSVGAYLPTLSDYIMWVCSRHLPRHLQARKGLIDDAASLADLATVMQSLSQAAAHRPHFEEFKKELASRERLNSEFDVGLFVDKKQHDLAESTRIRLNSVYAADHERGEIAVNGARLKLEPLSHAIVRLLADAASLTLKELCERLPQAPPSTLRAAVLELARYEVLAIARS